MGAPIVAVGVAIGELLETVGGRVVFGMLLDIVEALALGNPILAEILLGIPEHFLVAIISGKLGLLDSQFVGVGLGFVLRGWAKKNEEQMRERCAGHVRYGSLACRSHLRHWIGCTAAAP